MYILKCLECSYEKKEPQYQIKECGLIELQLARDIHTMTFKHKMEIIQQ